MKKIGLMLVVLFLINCCGVMGYTYVAGTIYEADMQTPVDGADVVVFCYFHGSLTANNKTTVSLSDGMYVVSFLESSECDGGDKVYVTAEKGGASGRSPDVFVHDNFIGSLDLAIANVAIPEFTTIAAGLALTGAGIAYLRFRRRY